MLRDYQQRAIDELYQWFGENAGDPCVVMPTGSGKSHVIAALCKDALQTWPDTRVLMLTHQKELIEQNAEKLRQHWPGAPLGIYSASLGKKQLGEPITFAGIQSIARKASQIGHIDLCIIDECHLVSHEETGSYRDVIAGMRADNPELRVIGFTATPYRLGHGLITDHPAIFSALLEPVSIEELIFKGYLSPLRSRLTRARLDTSRVKKRGGEFIERDLQAAVDTDAANEAIVREVIELAGDRRSWLFFCAGVKHAEHVRDELSRQGVSAACVTGDTPKGERARILADFKSGKIKAITNANVLTTGFDAPNIDLIAMLRPTLSTALYVQMAGRGMRLKEHTDHCLVLDFAGVVSTHGPITAVDPGGRRGDGEGEAMIPAKVCEACNEICAVACRECPSCGAAFPEPERRALELHDDDIMGLDDVTDMEVTDWRWRRHVSKASGKEMLAVTYYGDILSSQAVTEYFPVLHGGYAGSKALYTLCQIAAQSNTVPGNLYDLDVAVQSLSGGTKPKQIKFKRDGKFYRVVGRTF